MRKGVRVWQAALAFGFVAALVLSSIPARGQGGAKRSIRDLAWIEGNWVVETPRMRSEERWTDVGGNMMLGVSRTMAGGKTVAFEFLRIEERADGIFYVAQPGGKAPTDFKLTKVEGQKAIFENPAHDFPKRVIYWRNADGSMTARVDGGSDTGKGQEFPFKPMK